MNEDQVQQTENELNTQPNKPVELATKKDNLIILGKLFIFVLCSLLYLFSIAQNRFHLFDGEIKIGQSIEYTDTIMIFSYAMSVLFIGTFIYYLLHRFWPHRFGWKIEKKQAKLCSSTLDWLLILPICVTIATICYSFIFTFTVVKGTSMEPTIDNDDELLLLYHHKVERFDVVVIDVKPEFYDWGASQYFLKRIIGLPGDTIDYRMENGRTQLYVNGEKVEEYFYQGVVNSNYYNTFLTPHSQAPFNCSEVCKYKVNGVDGDMVLGPIVDGKLVIPEGYYFVLGDNRNVSEDSRKIGLVRAVDILGVVDYERESFFVYRRIK